MTLNITISYIVDFELAINFLITFRSETRDAGVQVRGVGPSG